MAAAVPDPGRRWSVAAIALVGLPLVAGLGIAAAPLWRAPLALAVAVPVTAAAAAVAATWLDRPLEASAAKAFAAAAAGALAASLLASPAEAVALAVVVVAVDAYSVFAGPTKAIVEGHPDVLDALAVRAPAPGGDYAAIGVSDLLFTGLFVATAARRGWAPGRTAVLAAASFAATYLVAVALDRALPALPLLSLAFLAANAAGVRAALRR